MSSQLPQRTHHTGARARKAAVRMPVALTGDTAAQEEPFGIPIIARRTFLGEDTWGISDRGKCDADPKAGQIG